MAEEKATGPDLSGLLAGLLGGAGAGEEKERAGGAADAISAVLSDPQMMAKLPAMIEMLRPMMAGGGTDAQAAAAAEGSAVAAEKEATRAEKPTAGANRSIHERRLALLRALRPYMSPRRQEAIDYILRMDRLGGMFRGM